MQSHHKIIIVGGGVIGLLQAISLAKLNYKICIIDKNANSINYDNRMIALSFASVRYLNSLNIFLDNIKTNQINRVQVSYSGFGEVNIDNSILNIDYLGLCIKYGDLRNCLYNFITENNLDIIFENGIVNNINCSNVYSSVFYEQNNISKILTCDFLIIADGGNLEIKNFKFKFFEYKQIAVVAYLQDNSSNNNIAFEHFDKFGPMVLLPFINEKVLVWTVDKNFAENEFIKNDNIDISLLSNFLLNIPFMKRFDKLSIKKANYFNLKYRVSKNLFSDNVVVIGNAAQIVHPVSAQGLNIGFRDVITLTDAIKNNNANFANSLSKYQYKRQNDIRFVTNFTHFLATKSNINNTLFNFGKLATFAVIENSNFLKKKITKALIFGM